jgi:hypothetical protein
MCQDDRKTSLSFFFFPWLPVAGDREQHSTTRTCVPLISLPTREYSTLWMSSCIPSLFLTTSDAHRCIIHFDRESHMQLAWTLSLTSQHWCIYLTCLSYRVTASSHDWTNIITSNWCSDPSDMNMTDAAIPSEEPSLSLDAPFNTYTHDKTAIIRRNTSNAIPTKFFTDFLTYPIRFLTSQNVWKTNFYSLTSPNRNTW